MGNRKSRYFCCRGDDMDEVIGIAGAEHSRLASITRDSFMNTEQKKKLPTCPICFDELECMKLRNCGHFICDDCFTNYIQSKFKDITQYPLKCFLPDCDMDLDYKDVRQVLVWSGSADEKDVGGTDSLGLEPLNADPMTLTRTSYQSTRESIQRRDDRLDTILGRAAALSQQAREFNQAIDDDSGNNTLEHWRQLDTQLDEIEKVALQLQRDGLQATPSLPSVEVKRTEEDEDDEKRSQLTSIATPTPGAGMSVTNRGGTAGSQTAGDSDVPNRDLLLYDRFCVMASVPPNEREQCPECEMIFIKDDLERKPTHFEWIEDKHRSNCHKCEAKFHVFKRRHHCRMCGDIFCQECTDRLMPLSAAHDLMIHRFFEPKRNALSWFSKRKKQSLEHKDGSDGEGTDKESNGSSLNPLIPPLQREKASTIGVRSCYACWYNYHRVSCNDCQYDYCLDCKEPWSAHKDFRICPVALSGLTQLEDDENETKKAEAERLFKELKEKEGWSQCPNCGVTVVKSQGCNHMTHRRCPNPSEGEDTHFCYCCSETLYGANHHSDVHGVEHFPLGIFEDCVVKLEENRQRVTSTTSSAYAGYY